MSAARMSAAIAKCIMQMYEIASDDDDDDDKDVEAHCDEKHAQ